MDCAEAGKAPGRRILVIDDDRSFLTFMEALLSSEDYDVDTGSSLDLAVERIRLSHPDILICDIWMPPAPRAAIVERLAELPGASEIPLILCTGAVDEVAEVRAQITGRRVEVLLKPFDIDDLFACIDRLR